MYSYSDGLLKDIEGVGSEAKETEKCVKQNRVSLGLSLVFVY